MKQYSASNVETVKAEWGSTFIWKCFVLEW